MPNNGMHPTRDTTALIKLNLVGGRVMPGVMRPSNMVEVTVKHILGAAVLSLGIFVVDVVACTCAEGSVTYYRQVATAVFLGKAVAKRPVTPADPSSQVEVTFEVKKVWKGRVSRTVTVLTDPTGEFGNSESMCAPIFAIGAEYLVFAYGVGDLSTDVCTGTSGFPRARKMLAKLGRWRRPAPGRRPPNNGMHPTRDTPPVIYLQRCGAAGDAGR